MRIPLSVGQQCLSLDVGGHIAPGSAPAKDRRPSRAPLKTWPLCSSFPLGNSWGRDLADTTSHPHCPSNAFTKWNVSREIVKWPSLSWGLNIRGGANVFSNLNRSGH